VEAHHGGIDPWHHHGKDRNMNISSMSIRNLVPPRGVVTIAIIALVVLSATRDVRAADNGTAANVITSAAIACEAMGGTANVDSVLDQMSGTNMTPVITMQCKGGKLDGFTCDGLGDHVKCGSIKVVSVGPSVTRTPGATEPKR
jgi:hypothetical protein